MSFFSIVDIIVYMHLFIKVSPDAFEMHLSVVLLANLFTKQVRDCTRTQRNGHVGRGAVTLLLVGVIHDIVEGEYLVLVVQKVY